MLQAASQPQALIPVALRSASRAVPPCASARSPTLIAAAPIGRSFTSSRVQTLHERTRSGMSVAVSASQGWTIVGGGRVGEALANLGENDVIVRRGESVPADSSGPIVVCTRNDDLQGVLDATPAERRKDLVFIQNGMLEPWLAERGLADNTQVLVYFAVAKKGDAPLDGKTDVNPEGLTAAFGAHAQAFADRLAKGGLSCKVLNKTDFQKSMLEKLVWISAFMLVGVQRQANVGEVESKHTAEVEELIRELAAAGAEALGIRLDGGTEPRLLAYARSVAHYPTALKEFPWRNGYFWGLSQQAAAAGRPDPCPLHSALLREVGAV